MDWSALSTTKHAGKRNNAVACNCIYQVITLLITPIAHKFAIVGLLFLVALAPLRLLANKGITFSLLILGILTALLVADAGQALVGNRAVKALK